MSETILRQAQVAGAAAVIGRGRACRQPAPSTLDEELAAERLASETAGFEQGLREGRQEGQRAGFEEGLALGRAEAARTAQAELERALALAVAPVQENQRRLSELITAWQATGRDLVMAAEDEMVALCFETIGRVLGAGAVSAAGVRGQLQTLRAASAAANAWAMHLHPEDVQLAGDGFHCVADRHVRLGGCVLRGAGGGLDARLEIVLEEIKDALLKARAGGDAE